MPGGGEPLRQYQLGENSERTEGPPQWLRFDPFEVLSQENTLDWTHRFFANMAEGNGPPLRSGNLSPTGDARRTAETPTMQDIVQYVEQVRAKQQHEMEGMIDSVRKLKADLSNDISQLATQGKQYDQQIAPAHVQVKLAGDVFRTMRNICRAPELTQANLSDFDQWAEEMLHTIETARTNEAVYNRQNIEFIYGNISLDLRSQAEGHVPEKMNNVALTKPKEYLELLAKLYTPADHLSTKRGEFEQRKQLATESPLTYLSVMHRLYVRAKYNDQAFLVERYVMGLLNEALKLQIVLHHRDVCDYTTLREAVVNSHSAMIKAVRVGKGTPPFSLAGLSQQSDVASLETSLQWKKRSRMGHGNSPGAEAMDLTQIDYSDSETADTLFFMGPDDLHIRDLESAGDFDYWEGELEEEQTTITELAQGDPMNNRTCYHCREIGHMKAQCPQRRRGMPKVGNRPMNRGRGVGRMGRQMNGAPRGRSSADTWGRGVTRGKGQTFGSRSTTTRTGVAQITEMPEYEGVDEELPVQDPEQDF